ncbi:MAG: LytTR family DNA-binding domain-containing protein [Bacteroidia bacterium]|nr:LytTR family DNA-binding domain-containing protein [Bacteroidia bacterium]
MLNHPYPISSNAINWRITLIIGLFISLFLLVFQPFGLSAFHGTNKYAFIAGYGLVTMIVLSIDSLLLKAYFKTKSGKSTWTVGKQIVMQVLILFTIGAGNYFYSAWHIHFYSPIIGFLVFQFFTTAVGLLPISIITILNENIRNKAFLKEARSMNESIPTLHQEDAAENPIRLTGENDKNPLLLAVNDFLYAESSGNYLDVRFVKDGKVKSVLLRTTLTRAEGQLEQHSTIMKCHRAFLVNCENIVQVKGNAQGLRLQLNHTSDEIPVSRNYISDLRAKMNARQA